MKSKHIPSGSGLTDTASKGKPPNTKPLNAELRFIKVFYRLREKYGVSVSDYCLLYCLHKDTGLKNAVSKRSNKELAEILGEHRNTVRDSINRLLSKALIQKSPKGLTVDKEVKKELREGEGYFSIIDLDLKKSLGLGWNECYLLWSLFLLEKRTGFSFSGTEHFCKTLFMPERTVKEALKTLEAKAIIERAQRFQNSKKGRVVKIVPGIREALDETENKCLKGGKG